MKHQIKKLTKSIGISLLTVPALLAANSTIAAETLDQRIDKLESLVKELKKSKGKESADKKSGGKHTYKFGGFIKATASYSDYSDGDLGANSGLRDFYIPGAIPVGGVSESQDFDFSAKESRIGFKSTHVLDSGDKLTTNIEMDFLLPPGGNERVSNSYAPRLRHAYLTYNNWLFGQTWSTFQDVGALPESVDFLGAADGIVFNRQPMIRYSNGGFQIAIENPETTVTPFLGGGRVVTDDASVPDFVARYNHKASWGHVTVAGLARQLAFNNGTNDESTSSFGLSLTGKFKVGAKDDIRFNLASGSGMGRYVGLNAVNGAVIDDNGNLETIDSTLAAVAYRHQWNSQWRSNIIVSGMTVDNPEKSVDLDGDGILDGVVLLTGEGVTKSINSVQVNLLHSPVPKLTIGFGFLSAERELESGADGDMFRTIFTAKYAF